MEIANDTQMIDIPGWGAGDDAAAGSLQWRQRAPCYPPLTRKPTPAHPLQAGSEEAVSGLEESSH